MLCKATVEFQLKQQGFFFDWVGNFQDDMVPSSFMIVCLLELRGLNVLEHMFYCICSHYPTISGSCAQLESYPRFDQWSFSQPLLIGSSLLLCQSTDTSIWLPHSKPGLSMAKQAKHVFVSYSLTTTVTAIAARQYYRKSNCMSTSKLLSNQTLFDLLS